MFLCFLVLQRPVAYESDSYIKKKKKNTTLQHCIIVLQQLHHAWNAYYKKQNSK